MAGHSKWANIQHRKGRQDKIRAKLFSKLSKEITVAAKMGDPDPDKNPRLRLAVKEAKSSSVPKDVIERAINKAVGGDAENYDEIRYEGYGPNGVAVIVEAMTDNRNRTASTVRSTFTKNGGNLGETGSVGFMFDRKGAVTYPASAGDADTIMMAAIEAGAEDVESDEEGHVIYTGDTDLHEVSNALEAELGESDSAKLIWKPNIATELDLESLTKLMKLIDALEDDDDVQSVTTNFEASDEVMAALPDVDGAMRRVISRHNMAAAVLQHPTGARAFCDHVHKGIGRHTLGHAKCHRLGHRSNVDPGEQLVHRFHRRAGPRRVTKFKDGFGHRIERRARGCEGLGSAGRHDGKLPIGRFDGPARDRCIEV